MQQTRKLVCISTKRLEFKRRCECSTITQKYLGDCVNMGEGYIVKVVANFWESKSSKCVYGSKDIKPNFPSFDLPP